MITVMNPSLALRGLDRLSRLPALLMLALLALARPASAHDYPTVERVLYVQECVSQHPDKSRYEMVNKCSCAIDKIASEVPFDDYETMTTASNANSIGGERGNEIRDAPSMQEQIKRYRALQASAKKSCFITDPK